MSKIFISLTKKWRNITYDATTGRGFVGKGDVQFTLNYNNALMQQNADHLVFTQDSEDVYDVTVEWDTGGKKETKHHIITQHKTTTLTDKVNYDTKVKKQVVGFILNGISSIVIQGENVPSVGDITNASENTVKTVTKVELVSHTESGLKVNGVLLVSPPVVEVIQ